MKKRMKTDIQKTLCKEAPDLDSESASPSLLVPPGSPSSSSTSPQFGSPESDRYSQGLYHPPLPATSPECFSSSSPEIEFSPSAPDGVLLTLYWVDSNTTTTVARWNGGLSASTQDDRGEEGEDEFDGWIPSGFIKVVKTAVLHLLNETIKKFMVEC